MTFAELSPREQQIGRMVGVEGLTSKAIARLTGLSPRTIETHRTHIYHKLEIANIVELARMLARMES